MSVLTAYSFLGIAIVCEVIGTTALKASDTFTRLGPSLLTVVAFVAAFFFMSLALRVLPTGIAYAVWSGVGIILISIISWVWFRQTLDAGALAGMALIIAGVVVINVFSRSAAH